MADIANITKNRVTYGWLEVFGETEVAHIPVSSFVVTYTMDEIPTAEVIPAIGKPLDEDEFADAFWDTIADIGKNMAARLRATINDEEQLLIDGYISAISTQDESSVSSRRMGASISIQGKAIKLAGAPSTSFVYSDGCESLPILAMKRLNVNIFSSRNPTTGQKKSINGIENFVSNYVSTNPSHAYWPAQTLRSITDSLYEEMGGPDYRDVVDNVIKAYTGAQIRGLNLDITTYLRNVCEVFSGAWRSQNAWEALRSTSKYLMMHIIPFNTGFYIANPYSLDRNTAKRIKTGEYLRLQKVRTEHLSEPINGVLMRPPAGIPYSAIRANAASYFGETYAFPRPKKGNIIDGYYHYRQFPSWLYKERAALVNKPAQGKPFAEKPDINLGADSSMSDFYKRVGNVVARAIYGQLLLSQTSVSITMPYRTDLMPGTRFVLENVDGSKISFIGSEMHGMVTSTQFRCSTMSDSPELSVTLQAVSVRNEEDNKDDNLTFDGHPIFDRPWVGTTLFGGLLGDVPPAPAPAPATAFNSGTGQNGS